VTVDVDPDGMLTVLVTDDGIGIPAEVKRSGLRNLTSRAQDLGGELRLSPADSGGRTPGPGWSGAYRAAKTADWSILSSRPAAGCPAPAGRRPGADGRSGSRRDLDEVISWPVGPELQAYLLHPAMSPGSVTSRDWPMA